MNRATSADADCRDLAIVTGYRTPFCRANGALQGAAAADLATHVLREVLDRTDIRPAAIDEVILGCAGADAREANVARVAALRAGLPESTPAVTVMRNCASGMEAVLVAQQRLRAGEGEVFLVGGTESMSNFPLVMGPDLVRFFQRLGKARSAVQRVRALAGFRLRSLKPRIAIVEGLTDPITGMMMGNTAEQVALQFGIDRAAMDAFALQSHERAATAQQQGRFAGELAPIVSPPDYRAAIAADDGVRTEQTLQALGKLKPVFDRHEGDVTVGNSCQVTDGAVALLCMSTAKAKSLGLSPLAVVRGHGTAALSPATMGLGPVHATPPALARAGIGLADLDLIEINEAFAAQVLACQRAFADEDYCRRQVGLPGAVGQLDPARLNVNGGAIALGHPIAATGARLVLTLAHELRRRGNRYGLATLCVGGGQGQAVVLEAA
ncbi:MAG TPA: acetyl-CoA C-acyltransferase [Planctomycetota bacterium]|nr:acetyl-CoA C-acyltransferase [Planctomycetota bacterium]